MYHKVSDLSISLQITLILGLVISIGELILTILSVLLFLSPRLTEKRIRTFLRFSCCCIIKDDEVLNSLVCWIASQQSFKDFSLTDVILGLLMTNMIFHDKRNLMNDIDYPDERLEVRTMRVHEYIQYIHNHGTTSFASLSR